MGSAVAKARNGEPRGRSRVGALPIIFNRSYVDDGNATDKLEFCIFESFFSGWRGARSTEAILPGDFSLGVPLFFLRRFAINDEMKDS